MISYITVFLILLQVFGNHSITVYETSYPESGDQWHTLTGLQLKSIPKLEVDWKNGFSFCISWNLVSLLGTLISVSSKTNLGAEKKRPNLLFELSCKIPECWGYYASFEDTFLWHNDDDQRMKMILGRWHHLCVSIDVKLGHLTIMLVRIKIKLLIDLHMKVWDNSLIFIQGWSCRI